MSDSCPGRSCEYCAYLSLEEYVRILKKSGKNISTASLRNYIRLLITSLDDEDLFMLAECDKPKNSRIQVYARQELAKRYGVSIH